MASLIDMDRLMKEFAGDEEILAELCGAFRAELPKMMLSIANAVQAKDSKALEFSAHTLKGAVANFQAQIVKDAAHVMEKQGRDNALSDVDENYKKLKSLIDALTIELNSINIKPATGTP